MRNLPSCVFVLSLLYMKRLRSLHSLSLLTKIDNLTTKEIYLAVTLLADKYLIDEGEDEQLFNSDLFELTGITNERFNLIERQVLLALNWNLFVSSDEFKQFFSLFKSQIAKRLNKNIDILKTDDSIKFYSHIIEYFALTSLFLIGITLSILTAIHIGTLTHSTLMKTLNPTIDCSQSSISYRNNHGNTNLSLIKQINHFKVEKYPLIQNKIIDNNHEFNLSTNRLSNLLLIIRSCCSFYSIQSSTFSSTIIECFG
ncbi:unnamed protein product [Rotaria sp. Silwood2]|nr:unnamed protein product [Rotaria sp. Silwood2]